MCDVSARAYSVALVKRQGTKASLDSRRDFSEDATLLGSQLYIEEDTIDELGLELSTAELSPDESFSIYDV